MTAFQFLHPKLFFCVFCINEHPTGTFLRKNKDSLQVADVVVQDTYGSEKELCLRTANVFDLVDHYQY